MSTGGTPAATARCNHAERERRGDVVVCLGCRAPQPRIWPDRHAGHRYMGPSEYYPCCGGRGYFPGGSEDSPNDRYCDCEAGAERRRTDSE